jgi:dolichol-phosphate mannosyltransferase
MSEILVFTATYNEKDNILPLIHKILSLSKNIDILVIDDNSPDGTWDLLKKISYENKNLLIKKRNKKLGLNTAHQIAFDYAKDKNYKKLITMDADFSHDPSEIPKIISLLNTYAFVIGSRYIKGGKNTQSILRYLLSFAGNKLIKLLLKIDINEFTTSFRGFNIKKLEGFNLRMIKGNGYSFFMETVVILYRLGFSCKEFPIIFKDRKYGKSKIPKIETLRTLKNLIYLLFNK